MTDNFQSHNDIEPNWYCMCVYLCIVCVSQFLSFFGPKSHFLLAHAPLGGGLGSNETKRSSDGLQDRLAQWLSPSSTRLRWNTSVSTLNIRLVQLNTTVHVDMVGYAAVVCCQSSQVHRVFQRCIRPKLWSCCAQDEGETRCFSNTWITWYGIST